MAATRIRASPEPGSRNGRCWISIVRGAVNTAAFMATLSGHLPIIGPERRGRQTGLVGQVRFRLLVPRLPHGHGILHLFQPKTRDCSQGGGAANQIGTPHREGGCSRWSPHLTQNEQLSSPKQTNIGTLNCPRGLQLIASQYPQHTVDFSEHRA